MQMQTYLKDKSVKRSIFIESYDRYFDQNMFSDHLASEYAQQILRAFPEAQERVDQILNLQEPVEYPADKLREI